MADVFGPSAQEGVFLLPTAWALSTPTPAPPGGILVPPSHGFMGMSSTARVNRAQKTPGPRQAVLVLSLEVCSRDFVAGLVPHKPGSIICHILRTMRLRHFCAGKEH